jgi:phosphoglycolate phosphatase
VSSANGGGTAGGLLPGRARAVVLDVDGTVLDVSRRYVEGYRRAAAALGLPPPSPSDVLRRKRDGRSGREILAELYPRLPPADRARLDQTRAEITSTPQLFEEDRPVAGAIPTLHRLRRLGLPIAFVTLRPDTANAALGRVGLLRRTDMMINVPGRDKTAALLELVRRLAVRPGDVVAVGDAPHDMAAARLCGMVPVGAGYGLIGPPMLEDAGAVVVLRRLPEIIDVVAPPRPG